MKRWSIRKKIYALGILLVLSGSILIAGYLFSTQQSLKIQTEAKNAADLSVGTQTLSFLYEQSASAVLKYIANPNQTLWDEKLDANKASEELTAQLIAKATDSDTLNMLTNLQKISKETLQPIDDKIQLMLTSSDRDTVFEYYNQEYAFIYEKLRQDLKLEREKADALVAKNFDYQEKIFKRNALLVTSALVIGISLLLLTLLQGVRSLSNSLDEVTTNLTDASSKTTIVSHGLLTASQQLSANVSIGADSFEEIVAALEQVASMVRMNADHAKQAAALSQSSYQSAENGELEIKNLIISINELSKSSLEIQEITSVIDDIAFQTNLLALNAAVEAARAGEMGAGFAVVADAVRSLAQRSATAANDITKLIKHSVVKTQKDAKAANESGLILKEIVESVKKVAALNDEIASASADQSSGLSQISIAMNQLDETTQTNAASASQSAKSSEEMSEQAAVLQEMVLALKVIIEGNTALQVLNSTLPSDDQDDSNISGSTAA